MEDVKLLSSRGRVTRRDYVTCSIVYSLFIFGFQFGFVPAIQSSNEYAIGFLDLIFLAMAILFIALQIVLSIGRLHDIGKGGGLAFLTLVPFVNIGLFIYLAFTKGQYGENEHGVNPRDMENTEAAIEAFNWGAFFLTPLWCFFHGRIGIGLFLIFWNVVSNIFATFIGIGGFVIALMAYLFISMYFGSEGNRIAWEEKGYNSIDELKKKQKGWNIAGIIVGIIIIFIIIAQQYS